MFANTQSRPMTHMLTALVAGALMLSACTPAISTTTLPNPTSTSAPLATLEPTATMAPAATATTMPEATAVPTVAVSPQLSMDTGSLAKSIQTGTVAAVAASSDAPYWEVLPEYTLVTLPGFPVNNSSIQPQIFIYPVQELGQVNEGAAKVIASLQTLLQSPQEIPNMPYLPLGNEQQVMHTQVQYLDFKNGQGLRYLTEFAQAIVPITNSRLIYTYQGLTSDGKYYVAAVLPVNHPSLPADENATDNIPLEFSSDYPVYLANVINSLNTAAGNSFTPDLTQLDAMMSSIEVK